ncbi:hypothetical protein [Clostridium botulinum]|uniref:hypothetical protein n=1 Tax=Clostridium botulinum TaxID=1491 RepID=UPI000A16EBFE|nr:hypothetical protein [Clostridium botulinum]AUN10688.1 hypothetical protein RSJ6_09310 [Clostridium botulinum]OSA71063.1 hypothetical protein B2H87_11925 [Clostridium botulinum]
MVFLKLGKTDNKKAKVVLIHYIPEQLSEDDKKDGILLKEYNEPHKDGKITIPYWNYESSSLEFEYKDVPKYDEELEQQKQQALNAKLLKDNAEIQIELNKQKELNSSLLLRIAELGGNANA